MAEVIGKPYDPTGAPFDPLVDLAGMWTTDLAERYLPVPGAPPVKYECLDGNLIMSPYEAGPNGFAMLRFAMALDGPARTAGLAVYPTVNLRVTSQRWIQPDLTVVRDPIPDVWAEADNTVLVGEFTSPSNKRSDLVDKPALCAKAGIPYFLLGKADLRDRFVSLRLFRLERGEYRIVADAVSSELFEVDEPFPISLRPLDLLDIRN